MRPGRRGDGVVGRRRGVVRPRCEGDPRAPAACAWWPPARARPCDGEHRTTRACATRAMRPRASRHRAPALRAARPATDPRARSRADCAPATPRSTPADPSMPPPPTSTSVVTVRCRPDRSSSIAPLASLRQCWSCGSAAIFSRSHGTPSRADTLEIDLGDQLRPAASSRRRLRRCRASSTACRAQRRARRAPRGTPRRRRRRRPRRRRAPGRRRPSSSRQPRRQRLDARRELRDRRRHVVRRAAASAGTTSCRARSGGSCRSASPPARRRRPCCRAPRSSCHSATKPKISRVSR